MTTANLIKKIQMLQIDALYTQYDELFDGTSGLTVQPRLSETALGLLDDAEFMLVNSSVRAGFEEEMRTLLRKYALELLAKKRAQNDA